jgi:hypothetical protein
MPRPVVPADEQSGSLNGRDESRQGGQGERGAELLFRLPLDDLERRVTVELSEDEMLGLAEAKEPTGVGILDNEDWAGGRVLLADDQIVAKLDVAIRREDRILHVETIGVFRDRLLHHAAAAVIYLPRYESHIGGTRRRKSKAAV